MADPCMAAFRRDQYDEPQTCTLANGHDGPHVAAGMTAWATWDAWSDDYWAPVRSAMGCGLRPDAASMTCGQCEDAMSVEEFFSSDHTCVTGGSGVTDA